VTVASGNVGPKHERREFMDVALPLLIIPLAGILAAVYLVVVLLRRKG